MNLKHIALIVDSCMDVPKDLIDRFGMYLVPVKIIYRDREYTDRVDITPQDVYDRLEEEIPRTSLPEIASVHAAFQQAIADGCKTVLAITISSALSGTNNLIRLVARDYPQVNFYIIDTLNIGIAAGVQAILAARLIDAGDTISAIVSKVERSVRESRVFFCLSTLEYLAKGGRIGKVAAAIGSLLNIKPIITCNPEGAYVVASKVRGRVQSIAETIALAVAEAKKHVKYSIAVAHGNAKAEARQVIAELRQLLPDCGDILESDVSPALVVHTGPGLIGIGVQALPV